MHRRLAVAATLIALPLTAVPAAAQTPSPSRTPAGQPPAACEPLRLDTDLRNEGAIASPTTRRNEELFLHARTTKPDTTHRLEVTSPYIGVVRTGGAGNSDYTVRPTENTTLRLRSTVPGCYAMISNAVRAYVQPDVRIAARRDASRLYTFSGAVGPAVPGMLVSLYRVEQEGGKVLTAQSRVQDNGRYSITRRFTGSGRFNFYVHVSQSRRALPGPSGVRPTVIH